jgi:hypothetical protein
MLFKIDENLHEEVAELLRQHGHDAIGAFDQQMQGHTDEDIAAVCKRERRVIATQEQTARDYPRHAGLDFASTGLMSRHDRGLHNAYNPGSRQNPQRLSDFPRQKTE